MKKTSIVVIVSAAALAVASSANAMTYYLTQDDGVQNNQHICEYSNNRTYAYNATDLCPMSIEDGTPAAQPKDSYQQPTTITGFYKGEYQDGMTKVCIYSVLGREEAIRLGSAEICPTSYDFQQ